MDLLKELQTKVQNHETTNCPVSFNKNGEELEKKPLNLSEKENSSMLTNLSGATLLGALIGGGVGAVIGGLTGYFLLRKNT